MSSHESPFLGKQLTSKTPPTRKQDPWHWGYLVSFLLDPALPVGGTKDAAFKSPEQKLPKRRHGSRRSPSLLPSATETPLQSAIATTKPLWFPIGWSVDTGLWSPGGRPADYCLWFSIRSPANWSCAAADPRLTPKEVQPSSVSAVCPALRPLFHYDDRGVLRRPQLYSTHTQNPNPAVDIIIGFGWDLTSPPVGGQLWKQFVYSSVQLNSISDRLRVPNH